MTINDFAVKISLEEGGKENLTIAQISEVLRITNKFLFGIPYALIKLRRK